MFNKDFVTVGTVGIIKDAGKRTDRIVGAGTNTAGRPENYHQMFQKILQDRNALAAENDKLREEKRQILELVRDLYGTISTDCEYTAGILERYDPGNADMISFLHMERINAEEARLEIMAEVGVPETFPKETDGMENFGEEEDTDADVPFR